MIFDFVEGYRASVGRKIFDFYLAVAANLNNIEDLLVFYFDLLSHSDASMKEVIRSKLASLFKGDIRDDILNSIKSAEKSNSTGIFGGDKKLRSALTGATKKDSVLKKAVVSWSYQCRRSDPQGSKGKSQSRSPSRTRSRSRSPTSSRKRPAKTPRYGSRKFSSRNQSRKKKSKSNNDGTAKRPEKK